MYVFKERLSPIKKDFAIIPNNGEYRIEARGVLHLKNLYKHIHEWLDDENYYDPDTGNENFENFYHQITKANGLMYHHIWWRVLKNVGKGNRDKFHAFLKVNIKTIAMSKHETMIDGKKFKTYKGEVTFFLKGYLRVDPEDKWNNHPILKHFQKVLVERWLKNRVDQYKKEIYDDILELQRYIKHYMGGYTDLPADEGWHEKATGI